MTVVVTDASIEVLGQIYHLKCAPDQVAAIQKAAQLLQEKMQVVRATTHVLSDDRITVLAALEIAHQFLAMADEREHMQERLRHLQNKIDSMLARFAQMELPSAE